MRWRRRRRGTTASGVGVLLLLGLLGVPASAVPATVLPTSGATAFAAAAAALQTSADLGHGQKVSRAASAPGGPVVPEGCRNFGHWVSSEARGTTCEDNPRPGRGPDQDRGRHETDGSED